jgi:hypothetical protein
VPSGRGDDPASDGIVSKVDYLRWLGRGDVFIDDREENVIGARGLGMTGILVPQPWNSSSSQSFNAALASVAALL